MRSLIFVLMTGIIFLSSCSDPIAPSVENRDCSWKPNPVAASLAYATAASMNWDSVDVQVEYLGGHGSIPINGEFLPIFLRGDIVTMVITISYSGNVPLNLPEISFADLTVWQMTTTGQKIPGSAWGQNPVLIAFPGEVVIIHDWMVPTNLYPPGVMQTHLGLYYNHQQITGGRILRCPIYSGETKWFFGG